MKHSKLWIGLAVLLVLGLILWTNKKEKVGDSGRELPPSNAQLVGPQNVLPENQYNAKAPLSKNKIILRNNMKIEIVKEGNGEKIENGQIAVVDYAGRFENGTIFDSSKSHGQPFSFTLGSGQVIKGWDEGVRGMKVGEVRTLTIPPEMGYGANGVPGVIPGNAILIFDVTLLGIN